MNKVDWLRFGDKYNFACLKMLAECEMQKATKSQDVSKYPQFGQNGGDVLAGSTIKYYWGSHLLVLHRCSGFFFSPLVLLFNLFGGRGVI